MNRRHLFSVSLLIGAAIVIYWKSSTRSAESVADPATVLTPPTTVYSDVAPEALNRDVRTTDTPVQTPEDNVVISQSFPNLGCRRLRASTTNSQEATPRIACGQLTNAALNEYAKRSTDELEALALKDAQAAQMLAFRSASMEPARTLKYVVRATALGNNDAMPLLWYMSNVKSRPTFSYKKQNDQQKITMNYVLSGVAQALGSHEAFAQHDFWQQQLQTLNLDADAIRLLDQHQQRMLEEIRHIQDEAGIDPTTAE